MKHFTDEQQTVTLKEYGFEPKFADCFLVSELIDILPETVSYGTRTFGKRVTVSEYPYARKVEYHNVVGKVRFLASEKELVDSAFKMIVTLKEKGNL